MTDGGKAGMFLPFPPNPVFAMVRHLLVFFILAAVTGLSAVGVPRALPVDPSEITPDTGFDPIDPAPPVREAKPLPSGEVVLPEVKITIVHEIHIFLYFQLKNFQPII